jgi:hypothetical protein
MVTRPISALAKEYGVSDSFLRNACKRMYIPRPSNGYWSKIRHGKPVEKKELPEQFEGESELIIEGGKSNNEESPLEKFKKEIENDPALKTQMPERLTKPDPLILQAKNDLEKKNPSEYDRFRGVVSNSADILNIRVSPKNLSRALRLMDTF